MNDVIEIKIVTTEHWKLETNADADIAAFIEFDFNE